jgi:glycosyltransferase involved in cell wall biosynthesis
MNARKPSVLMVAYTNYQTDPRVIREAEAAVSAGFDVDFLSLSRSNDPKVEMIRGVRVFHLNQQRYRGSGRLRYMLAYMHFLIRCFLKINLLSLKRRYRIAHVNNMPDFLVFCTLVPKLFGCKIMLDIHDPMPNTFASKYKTGENGLLFKVLLWQELLSARYSDRVLTVHEPVKSGILTKHGLNPDSIEVIANFADEKLFGLRNSYSVNGKLRLVFHGTILERYGLANVIFALSRLKNKSNVFFRIIGEGDFAPQLSGIITALRLNEQVEFVNRVYPVQEIPELIADCNLGIAPLEISNITNYALPLKLLEYTSLGLPVLTVRTPAISYYFEQDDCLFYDPADVESLRVILDTLADNPDLLIRYRERAVAIRQKFLWDQEKRKYIALLHELAGTSSAEARIFQHASVIAGDATNN